MSEISTPAPGAASSRDAAWPFPRRFVAAFTSPRALFEHLAERPSWLMPLLTIVVASLVGYGILLDPVMVPEQLAELEATGQATDQTIAMAQGPLKYVTYVFAAFLAPVVGLFLYSLVMLFIGSFVLGGRINFRQALALVSHASLVSIVGLFLRVPLAFATKSIQVSFGPGAFYPVAQAEGFPGKALAIFLTSFDAFSLWQTALVALGLGIIARVAPQKAAVTVWAIYIVISLVMSLGFGFMASMRG